MALGWLTLMAAATVAQPDDGAIVVTGERASRSVRKTASSVEVFSADKIEAEPGAERLDQLLEMTPNVTLGTTSLGPTIRGQNTTGVLQDLPAFLGGNRQRVTLQVDGRSVGYNEFVYAAAPLWDVAQVEVFRTPQSTTQGRNSIAGAIFIETEDPTYRTEARARGIVGDIDMRHLSGAVSTPLVPDQIAIRLSGDLRFARPSSKISDTMVGASPANDNYGVLRAKLLAEPNALPWLRLETSLAHSRSKMPQVEGVRPLFEDRQDMSPGYGVFGSRVTSLTVRARSAISNQAHVDTSFSAGRSRFQRFAPPGLGEAINRLSDWSIETVAHWRPSPVVDLTIGAHHLENRLDQRINLTAVLGNGVFDDRQRSSGLFGEVEVSPVTDLRLTAGLRRQSDRQRRVGGIGNALFFVPLTYDETFRAWLPKLSLAYDLSPALTAGALVQKAYNPGGATINFDTGDAETFGAEQAWTYELFARGRIGPASLRGNLFHSSFRNAQRAQSRAYSVPGGATAFWAEIENVPRSRSSGAELSLDWPITGRLRVAGGLGLLRTRITRTENPLNPINGKEFQRSPHWTAAGSIDWRPIDPVRLTLSARGHSRYFSTDNNAAALTIPSKVIVNARAEWTRGRFTLFGYARNVADTFYMSHLSSANFGSAVDPRELGVGTELEF